MRTIHWEMVGPALAQIALYSLVLAIVCTLFGTFVLKYFTRRVPIPLSSLAFIFLWAFIRGWSVAVVVFIVGMIFDWNITYESLASLAFLCIVGWLITRHMATHYGFPKGFPGVGAKVMFTMLALVWVIIGVVFVARLLLV